MTLSAISALAGAGQSVTLVRVPTCSLRSYQLAQIVSARSGATSLRSVRELVRSPAFRYKREKKLHSYLYLLVQIPNILVDAAATFLSRPRLSSGNAEINVYGDSAKDAAGWPSGLTFEGYRQDVEIGVKSQGYDNSRHIKSFRYNNLGSFCMLYPT